MQLGGAGVGVAPSSSVKRDSKKFGEFTTKYKYQNFSTELNGLKRADVRPQTHLPSGLQLAQKDLASGDQGEDHLNNDHVENMDTAREPKPRPPPSPGRII